MLRRNMLKRPRIFWVCLLSLAIMPGVAVAQEKQLLLLLSSDASYYQQTAQHIEKNLQQAPDLVSHTITVADIKASNLPIQNMDFITAIGSEAARYITPIATNTPILNALIPEAVNQQLTEQHQSADRSPLAAITIEQPHTRIIELALALPLKVQSVGSVSSTRNSHLHQQLTQHLEAYNVSLNHRTINDQQKPIQVLRPLFTSSDVFIALPDTGVFNRAIARWVLSLSFQKKVPVIGFSQAYTDAGALASVFSTPEDIGQHAVEIIAYWQQNGLLPQQQQTHPKYFTVATNQVVARAMGLDSKKMNEQLLHRHLMSREKGHE